MIIGLSGYAQTGKDTVATYLIHEYGYHRVAFADTIREALYNLNPTILLDGKYRPLATAVNILGWEGLKANSNDARVLLQRMGTEVGRNMFDKDFWVNQAFTRNKIKPGDKVVFTDVRYPNEFESIKTNNGVVWRIERMNVKAVNSHTSENALNDAKFDGLLINNSTKEDLQNAIDNLLKQV